MKASDTLILGTVVLACMGSAQAAQPPGPTKAAMATAVTRYLAKNSLFCIGRFDWPVDVPVEEFKVPTRDTLQMPTLENAGLVTSSVTTVEQEAKANDEAPPEKKQVEVRRYELTPEGRKFYMKQEQFTTLGSPVPIKHTEDFCAGRLSLDKVVSWTPPQMVDGHEETTVSYTFHMAAFPWAKDPDLQGVFPMVAKVVNGDGTMKLEQRFRRQGREWVAVQWAG